MGTVPPFDYGRSLESTISSGKLCIGDKGEWFDMIPEKRKNGRKEDCFMRCECI